MFKLDWGKGLRVLCAGLVLSLFGCVQAPREEKRVLPPMPKLAERPVTARAVIRGEKGVVLKEYALDGVRRQDGGIAFTVKRADLPPGTVDVRILTSCARAKKGEPGWWMIQRGNLSHFDRDELVCQNHRGWIYLPYFAMKTPRDTFICILEGMRFEHDILIKSEKGNYSAAPVWQIAQIGSPAYEDMTAVVYQLPLENDYNEMAKVYRSYKFANDPSVRTLKERIRTRPHLAKLAKSIALRQTHAGKPFDRKTDAIDFTPETEHPVRTYRTFDASLDLLKKFKAAGVDDIALCVAGWQTGGYDGRCPATFPVADGPGGEAGLKRLIAGGQALGYIIDGHSNYTDCFSCSPLWNGGEIACRGPNGQIENNGAWSGGKAHNLCLRNAWETFLPGDLRKIAALGFRGAHYVDVFTAVQPYRCCSPHHPANKKEQAEYQLKVAKRCHELFGGFASECSVDHLLGYVDYINYVCAPMRAKRQLEAKGKRSVTDKFVPFFELCFHDVVLSNPDKITQEVLSQRDNLILVEFGGRPIFYGFSERNMPGILKAWEQFKKLRHLQLEEMVEHRELEAGFVRITYANGDIIYVNHTATEKTAGGIRVPPQDFRLDQRHLVDGSVVNRDAADPRLPLADPHILCENGRYYAYGTHSPDGIAMAESTDLVHWKMNVGRAKGGLALHKDDSFGTKQFWAPEVHRRKDGKYVMFYSAEAQMCSAVADSPYGPFVQPAKRPFYPAGFRIDNTIAVDANGQTWMFYAQGGNGEEMWQVQLTDDWLAVKPGTEKFVLKAEEPWERIAGQISEGPSVVRANGRWWLLYSVNDCRSADYAVGFATAERLEGPWVKAQKGNPILHRTGGLTGVGHGAPFRDADGNWRYVFHAHNSAKVFGPRTTYVTDLAFGGSKTEPQITAGHEVITCVKAP